MQAEAPFGPLKHARKPCLGRTLERKQLGTLVFFFGGEQGSLSLSRSLSLSLSLSLHFLATPTSKEDSQLWQPARVQVPNI